MEDEPSQLNNVTNLNGQVGYGGNFMSNKNAISNSGDDASTGLSMNGTVRRIPMKPPNIPLPPIPIEATQTPTEMPLQHRTTSVAPSGPCRLRSELFDRHKIATLDAGK